MKLILLGKTKDDKGTQLEELTRRILEHQGFKDIVPNEQVAGASELDVTANKETKSGVKTLPIPVICECKAHGTPIVMSDWLKFIGKLTIARKKNAGTIGLMLALSGANGAVMGSYHTDFAGDNTTQLIANDDIVSLLTDIFKIPSELVIREKLQNQLASTNECPILLNVDLLYYHFQVWWVVSLADGQFTICDLNGAPQRSSEVASLLPMIENSNDIVQAKYFDLWDTVELAQQLNQINSIVLTILANGDDGQIDSVRNHIVIPATGEHIEKDKLIKAIEQNQFVVYDAEKQSASLKPDNQICFADFYRDILMQGAPVELLSSEYYQSHIDESLLQDIWTIQHNFRMGEDDYPNVLFILKHSPSALLYALCPDPIFQSYEAIAAFKEMVTLYMSHFMTELTNRFIDNYNDSNLHKLYLTNFDISKVSISSTIDILKSDTVMSFSTNRNYALAKIEGTDNVSMVIAKDGIKSSN